MTQVIKQGFFYQINIMFKKVVLCCISMDSLFEICIFKANFQHTFLVETNNPQSKCYGK